jgi:histidine triad (HIT) family protein
MSQTIFEKIVAGTIPCYKLYEDDHVIAILDIFPASKGHALVISKLPYPDIFAIPDEVIAAVAVASKKVSAAVLKAAKADGVNIVQNNRPASGQEVMHYHVHVIPRYEGDGIKLGFASGKLAETDAKELRDSIVAAL